MSTLQVNLNYLYYRDLYNFVREEGRRVQRQSFGVSDLVLTDITSDFKGFINNCQKLLKKTEYTIVLIEMSDGNIYKVDKKSFEDIINKIAQCGDLNKFFSTALERVQQVKYFQKNDTERQKAVQYVALHLSLLRYSLYTEGIEHVYLLIAKKVTAVNSIILRYGVNPAGVSTLVKAKLEQFYRQGLDMSDEDLVSVVMLALLYNAVKYKKVQTENQTYFTVNLKFESHDINQQVPSDVLIADSALKTTQYLGSQLVEGIVSIFKIFASSPFLIVITALVVMAYIFKDYISLILVKKLLGPIDITPIEISSPEEDGEQRRKHREYDYQQRPRHKQFTDRYRDNRDRYRNNGDRYRDNRGWDHQPYNRERGRYPDQENIPSPDRIHNILQQTLGYIKASFNSLPSVSIFS